MASETTRKLDPASEVFLAHWNQVRVSRRTIVCPTSKYMMERQMMNGRPSPGG